MAIQFLQRMTRLIRADAHGIIESLEDRTLLLKQHLREAELELQHKRARLATLADEEQRLVETASRLERAIETLDRDTQLALEGGREDLARFAIRKLLPKRNEADALHNRIAEIRAERDRITPKLASQEAEFEALRDRIREQLVAAARAELSGAPAPDWRAAEEEVEMELLRRLRTEGGAP
jgi:phage shock protein A